jgi:hypothetical protein
VPDAPKGSRGKKAKAAKAKEKYAEQDEEDRQLALQVRGWVCGFGCGVESTLSVESTKAHQRSTVHLQDVPNDCGCVESTVAAAPTVPQAHTLSST